MYQRAWARVFAERYALHRLRGARAPSGDLVPVTEQAEIRAAIDECIRMSGRAAKPAEGGVA